MNQNKNKIIKEFRQRIVTLEKDRVKMKDFVEKMCEEIEVNEKKYFDILMVSDYFKYILNNNHLIDLESDRVFTYSSDNEKIFLLDNRRIDETTLNYANKRIEDALSFYKRQVVEFARIVQLHIQKLELLETTFYKLLYTIEYLEYGDEAIKINNDLGYSYYFILYYNSLTGYESSKERMKAVNFSKEDIEKFIFDNSEKI